MCQLLVKLRFLLGRPKKKFGLNIYKITIEKLSLGFWVTKIKSDSPRASFQNSCCLFITRSRLKSRRKILGAFCKVTSFIFNFIDRELYPNLGFKIDGECGQQ